MLLVLSHSQIDRNSRLFTSTVYICIDINARASTCTQRTGAQNKVVKRPDYCRTAILRWTNTYLGTSWACSCIAHRPIQSTTLPKRWSSDFQPTLCSNLRRGGKPSAARSWHCRLMGGWLSRNGCDEHCTRQPEGSKLYRSYSIRGLESIHPRTYCQNKEGSTLLHWSRIISRKYRGERKKTGSRARHSDLFTGERYILTHIVLRSCCRDEQAESTYLYYAFLGQHEISITNKLPRDTQTEALPHEPDISPLLVEEDIHRHPIDQCIPHNLDPHRDLRNILYLRA